SLVFFGVGALSENIPDELPQPADLNLSWSPDNFSVVAQWRKPAGLEAGCEVNYELGFYSKKCPTIAASEWQVSELTHTWDTDENEVCVSITTNPVKCGNKKQSKPLFKHLSRPPGLVRNFLCVYYSHMKMNCTWSVVTNASDLQLFYRPRNGKNLKLCVSYIYNGPLRTGCHLYGEEFVDDDYFFLVTGTHKGLHEQSNFIRDIKNSVRIPAPKLNITVVDRKLHVLSDRPDFKPSCWHYQFYYKKCNENENNVTVSDNWLNLEYNEHCQYTFRVQAIYKRCGEGGSELSEPVYYGKNSDPSWALKVAMIVAPLVVTCCLIVTLVLFQRHKDYLFPKIPEPSLLFKDVLNGNKEKDLDVGTFYIPYEEVVEKKISLEPECTVLHLES
ncbi:hypothetical protein NFI96_023033, partial [Prochilodus magdalenae]